MSWMVMIYGFETEELAEQCRREVQAKYCKWAAKQDEYNNPHSGTKPSLSKSGVNTETG